MAKHSLLEGFTSSAGERIRGFFARSPAGDGGEPLQRGGTPSAERAGMPFNLAGNFGYDSVGEHLRIDQDLQARYTDAEDMQEYPEIHSALNLYADDACTPNEDGFSIWVNSDDDGVRRELMKMLHEHVRVEEEIWGIERTLAAYGNVFGEILATDRGVVGLNFLPPPTVRRIEGPTGQLLGFVQDIRGQFNVGLGDFYKLAKERASGDVTRPPGDLTVFEDWELVHMRLRGKHLRSVYGAGVIDGARWIWKRLVLLEDALLIYKLSRSPSRLAFYVDVGDYDAERGLAYVNRVKNQFTKKKFVRPDGKFDMRYNPLSMDEDFFIPVRGGKETTRVEVLQGPDYAETDTVEYHRDKLVSALSVPKSYLGYGGEAVKGSLANEDIRFARSVMRLQRETRSAFRKVCRVHLIARDMDPKAKYDLKMTVPSTIMELARLEVLSATADLSQRVGEILPTRWVLTKLFHASDKEAEDLMDEKEKDQRRRSKVEADAQRLLMMAQTPEPQAPDEGSPEQVPGEGQAAPVESRARAIVADHGTVAGLERRIGTMLRENREATERSFDRKLKSSSDEIMERVSEAMRDPEMRRRIGRMSGLVRDLQSSMRSTG